MFIAVNNYVLADGINFHVLTGPSGLQINGVDITQQASLLRATSMRFINRGNRMTNISFSVKRKHNSLLEAERFMLEHERDLPRLGVLTLTTRGTGGYEVSLYMAEAIVIPQSVYAGITTQHTYQIQGGELVSSRPATA